jgi:hypothetical protein
MLRFGVLPHELCAVMVWDRRIVDCDPPPRDGYDGWSSCLRTTVAGDVAPVYASGSHQGIARLILFTEDAEADADWGYGAGGRIVPVVPEITREQLLAIPELAAVFGRLQGRRNLPAAVADELLVQFPQLEEAYERLTGSRARAELRPEFETEEELASAFFASEVCEQFGLEPQDRGRHVPGCTQRTDGLASDGTTLVVVCLQGKRRALRRLLDHRALVEEHVPGVPDSHLIVGGRVSKAVIAAARTADVRVWQAALDGDGDLWLHEL